MSFTLLQQDNLKIFTPPLLLDPEKIVNFWNSLISLQFFQVLESLNTQQSKIERSSISDRIGPLFVKT